MQCAKFAVLQAVEADYAALCIHLLSLYVYAIALAVLCAGVALVSAEVAIVLECREKNAIGTILKGGRLDYVARTGCHAGIASGAVLLEVLQSSCSRRHYAKFLRGPEVLWQMLFSVFFYRYESAACAFVC